MNALFSALVLILLLSGTAAQAQGLSREQAAQALSKADTQMRRDAVSRLGEVGTMADATLLVNALRDADEDVRDRAEQAMWRIWARSGDQEVDRLYQAGVEQMSAGDLQQSIATLQRRSPKRGLDISRQLVPCDVAVAVGVDVVEVSLQLDDALRSAYCHDVVFVEVGLAEHRDVALGGPSVVIGTIIRDCESADASGHQRY